MAKKTVLSLLMLVFVICASAEEAGVKWFKGDLGKALETAKKEKKIVFIDFYADWCVPCKMLDKMVWQDADAAGQIKGMSVIPMKMDAEKEGLEAARKYSVRAYPTILFLDGEGREIARSAGFRDKAAVIETIRRNCKDPRTLDNLKTEWEKDPGNLSLGAAVARKLVSADSKESVEEAKLVLEKIFKADPDNAKGFGAQAIVDRLAIGLAELENVERRLRSLESLRKSFDKEISLLWDEEPLNLNELDTAIKIVSSGASSHFGNLAAPKLKDALGKVEALKNADVDISRLMDFEDSFISGANNPGLRELSNLYFDMIGCFAKNPDALNEAAWYNYRTQRKLEESADMARKAFEQKKDPNLLDTEAHILMSLGMKEQAIQKEKEAIEMLRRKGDGQGEKALSSVLSLFEKNSLDQLAQGVEPADKNLKRAEEE